MFKNLNQIKTTIIGLIFLAGSIYAQFFLFKSQVFDVNMPVVFGTIIGLGFLFAPDSIIEAIKKLVSKKTE